MVLTKYLPHDLKLFLNDLRLNVLDIKKMEGVLIYFSCRIEVVHFCDIIDEL